ncbi:threonine/serine dehydratase [Angustibacter luteus]|uniref:Threonine/serine dehydratase n=1 Tax=Angustibacter luteus TaxID=658456 RepID=A0ABW1JD03_9ACTN
MSPSLSLGDVMAARGRIEGSVRRTPVAEVDPAALGVAGGPDPFWLKLELLQHSGSFKARGAFNRLLSARESGHLTSTGVVAASGGNAGLAVAYAAGVVGVPAEIHVPTTAPAVKVARLAALGARVVQEGTEYAHAQESALASAAASGALFCHAYDQPEICAGQGTLGLELAEQVPDVDTVVLAVGGGGLMAGVATALAGRARVVGVEPETIPTLHAALAAGEPVDVDVSGIAADSLGARRLGSIAFEAATANDVPSVLVSEAAIIEARERLWRECRLVVEHGCAAAVAALVEGAYRPDPGERVAVVLCGANTDPRDLG